MTEFNQPTPAADDTLIDQVAELFIMSALNGTNVKTLFTVANDCMLPISHRCVGPSASIRSTCFFRA